MTPFQRLMHIAASPNNNPLVRTRKSHIVKAFLKERGVTPADAYTKHLSLEDLKGVPTRRDPE